MMSDRLLPCRVLLVWSLIVALILPVPLGGCVARKQDGVGFVSGASSDRAASASRADVAAVGPEKDADRAGDADRERPRGLDAALFNVAATFMGLPGLAPSSGARDEGLGYHQDGTARRAGSADTFDGRQARALWATGRFRRLTGRSFPVGWATSTAAAAGTTLPAALRISILWTWRWIAA